MNKLLDKYNFFIYNIIVTIVIFLFLHIYKLNKKHYTEVDIYKRRKHYV